MGKADLDTKAVYRGIPAMTPGFVHEYLRELGVNWTGKGVAMELGCWLGASSLALLEGLQQSGYDKPFYAFDKWVVNPEQAEKAKLFGVYLSNKQDSRLMYLQNVKRKSGYKNIKTFKGLIPNSIPDSLPNVEICIFDAPKRNPTFINSIKKLYQNWIPGVTIIGLLDFYFYKRGGQDRGETYKAPVNFMDEYSDNFTLIKDWDGHCSCAFFKYEKQLKL
jgi:hypothetical protein